jgi:hypothetical protein
MLPDQAADFHRIGWPGSTGIGGRLPTGISGRNGPDYAVCYREEYAADGFTPYYVGIRPFSIQARFASLEKEHEQRCEKK